MTGAFCISQDTLDSTNGDPDFMNTIITGDKSWVYRYDPETKSQSSQWNPMRTVNTTSLKCCLPSTDSIDRWGINHACIWRFRIAACKRASLKSTRFSQKKSLGTFITDLVC